MDVVVIEAPASAAEHAASLANACTAALSSGTCSATTAVVGKPLILASLAFDADGSARITVRGPGGTAARTLRFAEADELIERWRSAGLVIGTIAEGLREPVLPAVPPPQPSPPPTSTVARPPPPEALEAPAFFIDLGAHAGPALDDGTARGGPILRLGYRILGLPIASVVSTSYAYRSEDDQGVAVHWWAGGGGLAAIVGLLDDELWLDGRAEVVAHFLAARADRAEGQGSASRWLAGGRFGADAAWMPHRNVGAWIGLDVVVVPHGTQLNVLGDPVGRAPPYEVAPQAGIRAALP